MRLNPSDIVTYFKYDNNVLVGVEYTHKPTGVKSGVQPTRERADQMLRDGIEVWRELEESRKA